MVVKLDSHRKKRKIAQLCLHPVHLHDSRKIQMIVLTSPPIEMTFEIREKKKKMVSD